MSDQEDDLKLRTKLEEAADRTTALDVALQGLDDVVRRLIPRSACTPETIDAVYAMAKAAASKARAYRDEQASRNLR